MLHTRFRSQSSIFQIIKSVFRLISSRLSFSQRLALGHRLSWKSTCGDLKSLMRISLFLSNISEHGHVAAGDCYKTSSSFLQLYVELLRRLICATFINDSSSFLAAYQHPLSFMYDGLLKEIWSHLEIKFSFSFQSICSVTSDRFCLRAAASSSSGGTVRCFQASDMSRYNLFSMLWDQFQDLLPAVHTWNTSPRSAGGLM